MSLPYGRGSDDFSPPQTLPDGRVSDDLYRHRSMATRSSTRYNHCMVTLNAHFDGKTIVPDEPSALPFRSGARLRIQVEAVESSAVNGRINTFKPLDIHIAPELSRSIAEDPEFSIEEA